MSVKRAAWPMLAVMAAACVAARPGRIPAFGATCVVADPERPVFYASAGSDVLMIDIGAATVYGRVTVPGNAGPLSVSKDGRELFVGLTLSHDVGVIALPGFTFDRTLSLGVTMKGPTALIAGRPGRVYVGYGDAQALTDLAIIVDSATGAVLDDGSSREAPNGEGFLLGADGRTLVGIDHDVEPAGARIVDVSEDRFCYIGGTEALDVQSPDASIALRGTWSSDCVEILTGPPALARVGGVACSGGWFYGAAVSPTNDRIYVVGLARSGEVVTAYDAGTLAPFSQMDPPDDAIGSSMAVSADGGTLALLTGVRSRSYFEWVQLLDVASLRPNVGGVRARVIDVRTRQPTVIGFQSMSIDDDYAAKCRTDIAAGVEAWEPLAPGAHQFVVAGATHDVDVQAGAWTDLGTLYVDVRPPDDSLVFANADPPVFPGQTADVVVQGKGFLPGSRLVSASPFLRVNSQLVLDGANILANVSVSPAVAAPGEMNGLTVENPPPAEARYWTVRVRDPGCAGGDVVPPARVEDLRVQKVTLGPDAPLALSWSPVTLDAQGGPETMGVYETCRATTPSGWSAPTWQVTQAPSLTMDVTGDTEPCRFYLVRARDASGNRGLMR